MGDQVKQEGLKRVAKSMEWQLPRFQTPRSAYLHVPFCRHRCGYCNFAVIAGRDELADDFLSALDRELSWLPGPHPVDTLYIGGGTPTQLDAKQLGRLWELVKARFVLAAGGEFTVEANPADVNESLARQLAEAGVTRVSLGAQSFNSVKLQALERDHRAEQIELAVRGLQRAGLAVALDLIFGVPGETLDIWQADLEQAVRLQPNHVSTYGLTFERGTRFWARLNKGELQPVPEAVEQTLYEVGIERLGEAGLEHYEVSNFAQPGCRSRHNEIYWAGKTYFAAGPGAARHLEGRREVNHRSPTTYIKRVLAGLSPVAESEQLDEEAAARERFVFGMRRLEGVNRAEFLRDTGQQLDPLFATPLAWCYEHGLLADDGQTVRLTRRGLLVSDALWPRFL